MQLHLLEDSMAAGEQVVYPASIARAIYVTAGEITCKDILYSYDDGFVSSGVITLSAGSHGASIWRWDLSDMSPEGQGCRVSSKISGTVPDTFAASESFLRLDSVSFPTGGTAMLHTHQGPGIRCLREGTIRIDTEGTSTSYGPGGAWFEGGPQPVFAQADHILPSRFIRAMVLPSLLAGKSSIKYENEADKSKPKSQSYRSFGEVELNS